MNSGFYVKSLIEIRAREVYSSDCATTKTNLCKFVVCPNAYRSNFSLTLSNVSSPLQRRSGPGPWGYRAYPFPSSNRSTRGECHCYDACDDRTTTSRDKSMTRSNPANWTARLRNLVFGKNEIFILMALYRLQRIRRSLRCWAKLHKRRRMSDTD